ncbi:MAG: PQQ-dependent sugar dehydrogenase, partial [Nitrososphaeraceae archaeon]|nr:PQQ-dependent sugar dehydrogenase [Nitrososphaeraceae archaeon]
MSKINNNSFFYIFLVFSSIIFVLLLSTNNNLTPNFLVFTQVFAQSQSKDISLTPQVYDENLKVELVSKEFKFPTTFAFIGPNDFLILEKNTGEVKRVVNDKVLEKPLVKLNVSTNDERGLLGVAIIKKEDAKFNTTTTATTTAAINNDNITHYVFLYAVECDKGDTDCKNRIYRYELDNENNRLINPKLLLGIPSFPENSHIGGIIKIGPDGNLYLTVGNFQRTNPTTIYKSKTQNFEDGHDFDGRGGIISITQDGLVTGNSVIGDEFPYSLYYAYGIRNSFGINFDPVTGKLWDTENGPYFGDEVNIVEPGFNSGADKIFGIWKNDGEGKRVLNGSKVQYETIKQDKPSDLLYIGDAYYDKPKFIWDKTVAPTAIVFPNSTKLG